MGDPSGRPWCIPFMGGPAPPEEEPSVPDSSAVIGVGAIGSLLAASLIEAGQRPLLCVRTAFERLRVTGPNGLRIYDGFELATSPVSLGPVELVVVATKCHQTASAADWLRALVGPDTVVLIVQNGVEHGRLVAPFVPVGATPVPGIIDVPAQRVRPGEVVAKRTGTLRLPVGPGAARAQAGLRPTEILSGVERRADFDAVMWRKLAVNVISGAIPALTDRPAGVFREPAIEALARAVVKEALQVAEAEGTALPEETEDEIIAAFLESDPEALGSMLQDRRAGRVLETDARNGAVVRLGRRHGLPTPYNEAVAALAGALNQGVAS